MKLSSGSSVPPPDGSVASASTYGFFGSSPVTEASRTCTKPWSKSVKLVGGFSPPAVVLRPDGTNHHCPDGPARPSGRSPPVSVRGGAPVSATLGRAALPSTPLIAALPVLVAGAAP